MPDKNLTDNEIIKALEDGIKAERKSIYNHINAPTRFMPLYVERRNRQVFYCLERSEQNAQ